MIKKLTLGGGCFWGLQDLIRKQPGVVNTAVGYAGGEVARPAKPWRSGENPTYENHKSHAEVVEIEYDTEQTTYRKLLDFFFRIHNPTTVNRQGNDIGTSYRSVIFYNDEGEKKEAEEFIGIVNKSGRWERPVVTTLEPFVKFIEAEEYHQDYLAKNPGGYTCHTIWFDSYLD
ncbi:MAG TPA: peptide-methionine (S)-S-oxide reductase MsrA [Candidatus Paceibacterota bacterium]